MHYTAPEILLFIAAIGGVLVNIIMAWKTGTKVEQTLMKTSVIEGHVNSERTKLNEQLIHRQNEIQHLKESLAERDRTAAVLAQSLIQEKR